MGKRLVDVQPCFRAEDVEEVGDGRHTTFFEMLGNWSLGDYFKPEQLSWFFEFLTKGVGLSTDKLYVSVFEGNQLIPKDEESIKIWQELLETTNSPKPGKSGFDLKIKIYSYGADKNWWSRSGTPDKMPPGEIGGPDSEVFYDFGADLKIHEKSAYRNQRCHPNCECGRFLEIGNSVFMEYIKQADGLFAPLPNKNVDFGGGLERILAAKQNEPDVFKTDLFWPIVEAIQKSCDKTYTGNEKAMQVIADHIKAVTFMIAEGIEPSNKLQGYILRRLLRRAAVKMHQLKGGLTPVFDSIAYAVVKIYEGEYFQETVVLREKIAKVLGLEMDKFARSLDRGLKEFEKADDNQLNPLFAFNLFQTYGFPYEVITELFSQRKKELKKTEFDHIFEKHRQLSRTASAGMFKGGLADHSNEIVKLHTATHLLHAALRQVLGIHVKQVGSNINAERLRFDFTHPDKLTTSQIKAIEDLVNSKIKANLKIECDVMEKKEAEQQGALAFFGQKYPERVKVYSVTGFSKELCGGPHVDFTGKLGQFMIKKEEAVGSGKRRIYGVLKDANQQYSVQTK